MFTFTQLSKKELEENPGLQTRVCRIVGGKFNDEILYVNSDDTENNVIQYDQPVELLPDDFYKLKNYKLMKTEDRMKLKDKIAKYITQNVYNEESDYPDEESEYSEEYEEEYSDDDFPMSQFVKKGSDIINSKSKYDFELHDEAKMNICPASLPERVYISGANNSGKSYISGTYAREYNRLFPGNKVFMLTVHPADPAYDGDKKKKLIPVDNLIRINLKDEKLTKKPLDITKFKNTLVIFDDCDSIQTKVLKKWVAAFELDMLTNGRKYGIYMLTLSHMLMNYHATREKINECSRVIMFGQSGSKYHITNFLKKHGGLARKQIARVFKLPSRWFCISVNHPNYILYEKGAYLLSHDNSGDPLYNGKD